MVQAMHYNYDLQAWIVSGRVADCGHVHLPGKDWDCCNAHRYAGLHEIDAVYTHRGLMTLTEAKAIA